MKVSVITLGCKINQYDSALMKNIIEKDGNEIVDAFQFDDVCIINTCSVTQKSDYEARQIIRKVRNSNKSLKIIVTGCYAETNSEDIKKINGVDLIIGNKEKDDILRHIYFSDEKRKNPPQQKSQFILDKFPQRTRPFLKIQDGCNSQCSYCIVPMARGKSRSLTKEIIIDQINLLSDNGYKEVILAGVHLGSYGKELSPPLTISSLLEQILLYTKVERIRLSSIEPNDIEKELINIIKYSDRICRHLHIPLQSGDEKILNLMNRPYGTEYYRDLILRIASEIPDIAIGTDLIVGFPGEDDESFNKTYEFVKSLPLSYLHVFSYSPRNGTPAKMMENQVNNKTKEIRSKIIRSLATEKRDDFIKRFVGKEFSVLIERKRDKKTNLLTCLSSNYLKMLIDENDNRYLNSIQTVRIKEIVNSNIIGERLNQ